MGHFGSLASGILRVRSRRRQARGARRARHSRGATGVTRLPFTRSTSGTVTGPRPGSQGHGWGCAGARGPGARPGVARRPGPGAQVRLVCSLYKICVTHADLLDIFPHLWNFLLCWGAWLGIVVFCLRQPRPLLYLWCDHLPRLRVPRSPGLALLRVEPVLHHRLLVHAGQSDLEHSAHYSLDCLYPEPHLWRPYVVGVPGPVVVACLSHGGTAIEALEKNNLLKPSTVRMINTCIRWDRDR